MRQKLTFFNDLPIGAVAAYGDTRFVKFADADRYKNLHDHMPNALNLDNSHYLSVCGEATCTLIKVPKDAMSKYTLDEWISKITSL